MDDLNNEISALEEHIWLIEGYIEEERDSYTRCLWARELAWMDQRLAELHTFIC